MGSYPKYLKFFLLIFTVYITVLVNGYHGNRTKLSKYKTLQTTVRMMYNPILESDRRLPCNWLKTLKRQYKLCRSDSSISDILLSARNLTISNCEHTFRYNRWNCSRPRKLYKNVYRETALLYAMTASAITYSIAEACADGSLISCYCRKDSTETSTSEWKWGVCSDNIKYSKQFTKRFLQINQKGDYLTDILRHDSQLGIDAVSNNVIEICRCQGLSGSCSIKTCFRRIETFPKIAYYLKEKYHTAVESTLGTNRITKENRKENKGTLLYLTPSPTFCKATIGRRCENRENCVTICCGRGFNIKSVVHMKQCNCKWKDTCCIEVKCDQCRVYDEEFYCK